MDQNIDENLLQFDQEMLEEPRKRPDLQSHYESQINELQSRISRLELKNKEYLDMFCGTAQASTNCNDF